MVAAMVADAQVLLEFGSKKDLLAACALQEGSTHADVDDTGELTLICRRVPSA